MQQQGGGDWLVRLSATARRRRLVSKINSFAGKANYYGTHGVQNKLQENVVSKQLTLYDQETTYQYVVYYKVLTVYINRVALVYHLRRNIALLPVKELSSTAALNEEEHESFRFSYIYANQKSSNCLDCSSMHMDIQQHADE